MVKMRVDTNGEFQQIPLLNERIFSLSQNEEEADNIENTHVDLKHVVSWNFDIILLEQSEKRPLTWLGKKIFGIFDASTVLCIEESVLDNWLNLIEINYHAENPYHNATHAADVLQATAFYLSTPRLQKILDPLEHVTCLIAAIVHDVDHPGTNNAFLINSDDDLALLYNDKAILESHHSALAFKLTTKNSEMNIFRNLELGIYRKVRENIIDMILATEMAQHKTHVTNFVNILSNSTTSSSTSNNINSGKQNNDVMDLKQFCTKDNLAFVKMMLIKCADVSNPARPLKISVEWTKRISEEFFKQTDIETQRSLPLTLPMYDRKHCSIPQAQLGFFDFFITDLYTSWHGFVQLPELIKQFRVNYDFWKGLEKKNIKSTEELGNYLCTHPIGEND